MIRNTSQGFACKKADADIVRAFLNRIIPVQVAFTEGFHFFLWRRFVVYGPEHMVKAVINSARDLKRDLRAEQATRERRLKMDRHAEAFNERKQKGKLYTHG